MELSDCRCSKFVCLGYSFAPNGVSLMKATKTSHDRAADSSRKSVDVTNFEYRTLEYDCLYTKFRYHTDILFD